MVGSSPLARGLPSKCGATAPQYADHPRSRGVYAAVWKPAPTVAGSSPLARGLLKPLIRDDEEVGIIPARAGFTVHLSIPFGWVGDHPRSRGVYRSPPPLVDRRSGSSPLARGLLLAAAAGRGRSRIIPARAGFTSPTPCPGPAPRDHPRSRGVYSARKVVDV